jgi:hypothetical protein
MIYWRIKLLKNRVSRMLSEIEVKYHEQVRRLTREDKLQTLATMRTYMSDNKIDHLKYLDYEEQWLEDKITKFGQIASHYDTLLLRRQRLEEELDTVRVRVEVCREGRAMEEFVVVSGVCANHSINMLERVIFRQTRGHSLTMFSTREREPSTSVFLCMMNKHVYKHVGYLPHST